MNRLLPLLALAVSAPAFADLQKCVDPQGTVTYTDKDCPSTPRPATTRTVAAAPSTVATPTDAPLDVVDTGIAVITQIPGRFAWLDNDTLAITTFADPAAKAPWMLRRIVAWDASAHTTGVLVPRGFIDCVEAGHRLVSLDVGDLESRFAIGSHAAPSVQQFALWDAAARKLAPAPSDIKAAWHPSACLKPAPEDLAVHDLLASKKAVRYLQPEHGTLSWGALDENGHPGGPMLVTPRKKIALALGINEISHEVRWLEFRKAYQVSPGLHDRQGEPPQDAPLVTMDLDGRLSRHAIPAGLTRQLDALNAPGPATMVATRAGDLVVQAGGPANGGGLYLAQGEQSHRIWCTAKAAPGAPQGSDACTISQPVAVSPDGCRIAFDSRQGGGIGNSVAGAPTVKVITLCDGSAPVAAGRKKAR